MARRTAWTAVAIAALLSYAAAGCDSGGDDTVAPLGSDSPSPAATPPPTTPAPTTTASDILTDLQFTDVVSDTSTGDDTADGALRAYVGFTEIVGRLLAEPDPDAPGLERYASDPALAAMAGYVAEVAGDDMAIVGTVIVRPEAAETADRLVLIEDCMDQSDVREHRADGSVTDPVDSDWLDIRSEVHLLPGAGWRIATYEIDERSRPCGE